MSLRDIIEAWRVRRLAKRLPNIQPGEWLFDLGRPTPLACRIKQAYHLQQREVADDPEPEPRKPRNGIRFGNQPYEGGTFKGIYKE